MTESHKTMTCTGSMKGSPAGSVVKNPLAKARRCRGRGFDPWVRKSP